ncbi:MAG: malto-oligosyltrehalose trehalohydrolase [Actinomycetales bacterium]|nr:MAG: malto-oligosyltrehalose trehalohydrolase [Actinomycetales bacterium]
MEISVWAPTPDRVQLRVGTDQAQLLSMTRDAGGWWRTEIDPAVHQPLDYAFLLDDDPIALPDPRSAWQPYGVHGPSRWVDIGTYPWTDQSWAGPQQGSGVLGGVFYELHIGTFTEEGTFDAAISRLDHLVELGVDVVGLMPVAAFPGRWGWGYDGAHPYAVHDPYGGPIGLARFVDACHRRGLAVSLDVVYNHLGPVGNYVNRFGPYFSDRHHTPWGSAVNFDGPDSAPVRRWVIDNALRWLRDFHIDALRLDATHEMHDDSARHVLVELSEEVAGLSGELGRPLALVAESDLNDPRVVTPVADGGLGMTAQWDDDVHHALHVALTGETQGYYADFAEAGALAKTLTDAFFHDGRWSSFRGTQWGAPVDRTVIDGRRFVVALQTHDQVGNRAVGDRIHDQLSAAQHASGATLCLLSAYTPMLFMGEEWAAGSPWQFFTDFDAHEPVARGVSQGRRAEFAEHGWLPESVPDPQDPATRAASVLRWDEPGRDEHARMLAFYRSLITLRRDEPELRDGRLDRVSVESDSQWLAMRRGRILVVVSFAAQPITVPLGDLTSARLALAWDPDSVALTAAGVGLGAHGVAVLIR